MSVLIKGQKLPSCCYYCSVSDYNEVLDELYCGFVNGNVTQFHVNRHPDCPLVDVPTPHGDLVDIEKVTDEYLDGYRMELTLNDIYDLPIVIEAESEE